jgi:hypothetical protein
MRDSTLNTNENFDYGAFLDLKDELDKKKAKGSTAASLFSFTFTEVGSYIFTDAASKEKMMMVSVVGPGESCSNPDQYVKMISTDTLSEFGMPQSDSIIIKPDYPLLISLGLILIFSTAIVMTLIAYCLHK